MKSTKTTPAYASATAPPPDSPQKGTLFCPSCGHESPITGDWDVVVTDEGRAYQCPWCHTVISNRPDDEN